MNPAIPNQSTTITITQIPNSQPQYAAGLFANSGTSSGVYSPSNYAPSNPWAANPSNPALNNAMLNPLAMQANPSGMSAMNPNATVQQSPAFSPAFPLNATKPGAELIYSDYNRNPFGAGNPGATMNSLVPSANPAQTLQVNASSFSGGYPMGNPTTQFTPNTANNAPNANAYPYAAQSSPMVGASNSASLAAMNYSQMLHQQQQQQHQQQSNLSSAALGGVGMGMGNSASSAPSRLTSINLKEEYDKNFDPDVKKMGYRSRLINDQLNSPGLTEKRKLELGIESKMLSLREYQRLLQREILAIPSSYSLAHPNPNQPLQQTNAAMPSAPAPLILSLHPSFQIPASTVPLGNLSTFHHRVALEIHGHEKQILHLRRAHTEASEAFLREQGLARNAGHHRVLTRILDRYREVKTREDLYDSWRKEVNKEVLVAYEKREKRVSVLNKKRERDRLIALKADDEEGYLRLLADTKNERLSHLLEQTDAHLHQIGILVQQQQEAQQERKDKENQPVDQRAPDEDEDEYKRSARPAYYSNIHKIVERVKQPTILKGGLLKEYQLTGLEWLVSLYNNNLNGILADEMGLGKTIQTIALLCYLCEFKKNTGPFLIIAPLSTLDNWIGECAKWAPSLIRVDYRGSPSTRKDIYDERVSIGKFNVLFTTFEYIMKDYATLGRKKWKYIIIDEGHRMKNFACKLATTLVKHFNSQHRLILTGTPLQNNLPELWSLLNFLLPTIFHSVDNFEQWFNAPFANTNDKIEMNEEETLLVIKRLHKVLRPFLLRRMKTQVEHQLPAKVEEILYCEMSALQRKYYQNFKTRGVLVEQGVDGKVGHKGINNTIMQLRKVCNHPYIFNIEKGVECLINDDLWRAAGKFELLDKLLPKMKAFNHRVLLFSQFTSTLDVIEYYLRYRGMMFLRLDGTSKDRGALLEKFNAPQSPYFIFILSTRAGGLGLNLQSADTVIIFDSDWNPMMDLQAQDRAHRIGQQNEVKVFRFITLNSVEEKILSCATAKLDMDQKVIEAGQFNDSASASDHTYLLNLLREEEVEQEIEAANDTQINSQISRGADEFKRFEEMDREREEKRRAEWTECGHLGFAPPRLMVEKELPDWLQIDIGSQIEKEKDSLLYDYGRGQRVRDSVTYAEDMPDDQWLDELQSKKRKKVELEANPGSGTKKAKLTNGKSGSILDDPKELEERQELSRKCLRVWQAVKSTFVGPDHTEVLNARDQANARNVCELFLELPDKTFYVEYYLLIKKPIAMNVILRKIQSLEYDAMRQFHQDFCLMFSNAFQYNADGSEVFLDAQLLQRKFMREFAREFGLISNPAVFSFSSLSASGSLRGSRAEFTGSSNNTNDVPRLANKTNNNSNSSAMVTHNPKLILNLKIPKKDGSVNK